MKTNQATAFFISDATRNEIARHAREAFPEECCGVVFTDGSTDWTQRVQNIQNQLHALDPQTYPRDARIAYAMDPKELEALIDAAQKRGAKLKAFYHSHPNHDAYFSQEDKAFASPFGEPTFPGAAQIVVSIYRNAVKDMCVFLWSEEEKDFVAVPLQQV